MFVLTVNQRRSRLGPDLVPQLLDELATAPLRLPAERTVGDEAQALADSADDALAAILRILEHGPWSIGVGIGDVRTPLPHSVREGRGEAFGRARTALEAARRTSSVPLCVRTSDRRLDEQALEAEALLRLMGRQIQGRQLGQWRVVREARRDPEASQQELAQRLGIRQQTVSRALTTSGWREEVAVTPLARRQLAMLDLTATGGASAV